MLNKRSMLWLLPLLVSVLVAGCSQSFYMQGRKHLSRGEHDPAIEAFYKEISTNPQNAHAWRELGVAFYEKGDLAKAEDALKQANNIKPDARTHLYLGLIHERQEDFKKAIDAYTVSLHLQPRGKTATMTRAHLERLIYKKIEDEISQALENEAAINIDTIPDNTIAVADFDGSNLSAELVPIAKGLAEFTAIDLAKVHSLTVVERQKLDVLMRERQLSRSGYIDPATAPRLGRLMGARKLVTGSVLGIGDKGLKLDGAIVNTDDSSTLRPPGSEGELQKFFKVQKDFVFNILKELGITLSAAERDDIEKVPTESYLAFLAYCRGLDFQSRGMYGSAEQAFAEAVSLDQNFQQARDHMETVSELSGIELSPQQEFSQFEQSVSSEGELEQLTGLDSRLTQVAQHSGTIPSDQSTSLQPAVISTATVRIKGNLDAQ
ncbi:MAG: tetratricopeptide repeat protein [Candidatus Zixiibacteriota bacterium]